MSKRFKDAIENFPLVGKLKRLLRNQSKTHEEEFSDRCGNCNAVLETGDKYCKYCGTERGKGAFKPYMNQSYTVYGPPIKKKYKCGACGHMWITVCLGGDKSKYCPKCGKNVVNVIENTIYDE